MQKHLIFTICIGILLAGLFWMIPESSTATADQSQHQENVANLQGETSTPSLLPTATRLPTSTPSGITPSPTFASGSISTPRVPELTPATPGGVDEDGVPIPTPLPTLDVQRTYDIFNFLLIGHDSESDGEQGGGFRTDTIIVLSVNRTAGTVSMLSLPRDLYVYIPNWRMQRINVAWAHGGGSTNFDAGFATLRDTIYYNFGIQVHYYAVIDFSGFKMVIDTIGSVTIPVDCAIQDYRFTGNYDEDEEPIFELTTIDVGLHEMDSTTALMYARSRRNSNDFDRGRRQQQLLRAIFSEARQGGWFGDIPSLYNQLSTIVQTNIPLEVALQIAPITLSLTPNQIESHFFQTGRETNGWTSPSGAAVQLPTEDMQFTIRAFLTPPTQNRLVNEGSRIGIFDTSGTPNRLDIVAAERLVWEGLNPLPLGLADMPEGLSPDDETIVIDFTGQDKGNSIETISRILNVHPQNVFEVPDPDRTVDYAIYLSPNYNACIGRQVTQTRPGPPVTATPSP